jgi:hypothetical protein
VVTGWLVLAGGFFRTAPVAPGAAASKPISAATVTPPSTAYQRRANLLPSVPAVPPIMITR